MLRTTTGVPDVTSLQQKWYAWLETVGAMLLLPCRAGADNTACDPNLWPFPEIAGRGDSLGSFGHAPRFAYLFFRGSSCSVSGQTASNVPWELMLEFFWQGPGIWISQSGENCLVSEWYMQSALCFCPWQVEDYVCF